MSLMDGWKERGDFQEEKEVVWERYPFLFTLSCQIKGQDLLLHTNTCIVSLHLGLLSRLHSLTHVHAHLITLSLRPPVFPNTWMHTGTRKQHKYTNLWGLQQSMKESPRWKKFPGMLHNWLVMQLIIGYQSAACCLSSKNKLQIGAEWSNVTN